MAEHTVYYAAIAAAFELKLQGALSEEEFSLEKRRLASISIHILTEIWL